MPPTNSKVKSPSYLCQICGRKFGTKTRFKCHLLSKHDELEKEDVAKLIVSNKTSQFKAGVIFCKICDRKFQSKRALTIHKQKAHRPTGGFEMTEHALNKACLIYRNVFTESEAKSIEEVSQLFDFTKPHLVKIIREEARQKKLMKIGVVVMAQFVSQDAEGKIIDELNGTFRAPYEKIMRHETEGRGVFNKLKGMFNVVRANMNDLSAQGSNWVFRRFTAVNLEIGGCGIFAGSEANQERVHKAVLSLPRSAYLENYYDPNCVDGGDRCFFYAVALALTDEKNNVKNIVSEMFNLDNIKTPVTLAGVLKFERQNKHLKLAINVLLQDAEKSIYPVYVSKNDADSPNIKTVNLLMLEFFNDIFVEDDNSEDESDARQMIYHYVYIKDIDKYLRKSYKYKNKRGIVKRAYSNTKICVNCLNPFSGKIPLRKHASLCGKNDPQALEMPHPGENEMAFKAVKKISFIPIVGFFDFESQMTSKTVKCLVCPENRFSRLKCNHVTSAIVVHEPMMYNLIFVDINDRVVFEKSFCGTPEETMTDFFKSLRLASDEIDDILRATMGLNLSPLEMYSFNRATKCWICKCAFLKHPEDIKVRDHDHFNGDYLGAAHRSCNLKRRMEFNNIPIYCHNLSGYDSHFIFKYIELAGEIKKISGLPLNSEKFRTIKFETFQFVDSLHFLSASLAAIVDNLCTREDHPFSLLKNSGMFTNEKQKKMLLRKGVFPYEWNKSANFLKSHSKMPNIEAFHSSLSNSSISQSDYDHARHVFDAFGCKNMLDYCSLYCKLDTYLLAECFMAFRKIIMSDYNLDPAHYISLPQLAFDAMLKLTAVQIELITNIDQYMLIAENIRGGVSFVNERKVVGEQNAENSGEHLLYLDVNNLYGKAQCYPMPVSDYRWLSGEEIEKIDWQMQNDEQDTGYILEVDLSYPDNLHLLHEGLPLAPESKAVRYDILSDYAKRAHDWLNSSQKSNYKAQKLIGHFLPRKKYGVHYMNLKTYLDLGMKLDAVHRVIAFTQTPFLKEYVEETCRKRALAKTKFEKNCQKLMNNAVYGKTIQNNRKFTKLYFYHDAKKAKRAMAHPLTKQFKIFHPGLAAIIRKQGRVTLDRCYAVGFTILERSKDFMYKEYYYKILPRLGGVKMCKVVMSDTDSLILRVHYISKWRCLDALKEIMDFSNYPKNHPLYSETNKMQLGFWKDELEGRYNMVACVCIRSKAYAYVTIKVKEYFSELQHSDFLEEVKKCKGVVKSARAMLSFEDYDKCLNQDEFHSVEASMTVISSKNHVNHTKEIKKRAFSSFDDKRFLRDCGMHSTPYGSRCFTNYCSICKL